MFTQQKIFLASLASTASAIQVQMDAVGQCDLALGPGMILDLTEIHTACCAYAAGFFLPGAYDNPQAAPMMGDGCLMIEEWWPYFPDEYKGDDGSVCDPNADPALRPYEGVDLFSAAALCCTPGCQVEMLEGMAGGSGMLNGMLQPTMFDADGDLVVDFCPDIPCMPDHCMDGTASGTETDVDCGGDCPPCQSGQICATNTDCASGACGGSDGITCYTDAPTPTPPTFAPTPTPPTFAPTADPTAAPTPTPPTFEPTISPTGISGAESTSAAVGLTMVAGAVVANMM